MKEYYTINDVAMMSGLTTRTIRNYMQMGLLDGEKEDGVWRFTSEEFEAFLTHPTVLPSIRAKRNAVVYDFLLEEKKQSAEMCTILDLNVSNEEAQAVSDLFCNAINSGEYGDVRFSLGKTGEHVRVILSGKSADVGALLAAYHER